ncbi:MAG TPA: hypothetical protein VGU74_00440 [Gemmatimonadales bacterium]|nr:hypothetical protein [Gemmatimonadales bacterium]
MIYLSLVLLERPLAEFRVSFPQGEILSLQLKLTAGLHRLNEWLHGVEKFLSESGSLNHADRWWTGWACHTPVLLILTVN